MGLITPTNRGCSEKEEDEARPAGRRQYIGPESQSLSPREVPCQDGNPQVLPHTLSSPHPAAASPLYMPIITRLNSIPPPPTVNFTSAGNAVMGCSSLLTSLDLQAPSSTSPARPFAFNIVRALLHQVYPRVANLKFSWRPDASMRLMSPLLSFSPLSFHRLGFESPGHGSSILIISQQRARPQAPDC